MSEPIWYVGPLGNLRPFVCPERDVDVTVERFGGIFQGLSGARSLNVTGLRQKFSFDFRYLDKAEFAWLEALNMRVTPGPYRLLNPFKVNRLTAAASLCKSSGGSMEGAALTTGFTTRVWDWPVAAGDIGSSAYKWTNRAGTGVVRLDDWKKTTVTPGEQITGSVYLKGSTAVTMFVGFDLFDRDNVSVTAPSFVSKSVTTAWTRQNVSITVPANAVMAKLAFYTTNATPDISFTAAQVELGATPTAWELGGGAPVVSFDQMSVVTPRFPYRNTTLTLLET